MSRFLFVHGVYHGPECWDGVVERLRAGGHECHVAALRGHGPDDRADFDFSGVGYQEYLEDVRAALDRVGDRTILVGHSLGGMLVRSVLAEREIHGAVLLCVPTPASLRRGTLLLLKRFPRATLRFLLSLRSESLYHDPEVVPWLFWSCPRGEVPELAWLDRVLELREPRRLFWDVQWVRARRPRGDTPVLVLGGGRDFALAEGGLRDVAEFHRGTIRMIPEAPHDMMLTHPAVVADHLEAFTSEVAARRP